MSLLFAFLGGDASGFHGGKSHFHSAQSLAAGGSAAKAGSIAALNQQMDMDDEESASVSDG